MVCPRCLSVRLQKGRELCSKCTRKQRRTEPRRNPSALKEAEQRRPQYEIDMLRNSFGEEPEAITCQHQHEDWETENLDVVSETSEQEERE